jgi:MYXO-CTERM domain-containing protein
VILRPGSRTALAFGVVSLGLGAGLAAAEPAASPAPLMTSTGLPGRRVIIDTPVERSAPAAAPAASISTTIYLERCIGGCVVHKGANDARTNTSMIPMTDTSPIGEFRNSLGQTGSDADAEWGQLVLCMREVYSPYNVVVTDVKPTSGQGYHEAMIAGSPGDIGLTSDILGVAPLASDCRAIDDVMSFTFASNHPKNPQGSYIPNICWTAAQESAHAFGLDHEYSFTGNRSACNDPMTYRNDCGGEKFFRNEAASCGETAVRACKCGATQNSHLKLVSVFGAGTPITRKPTISLTVPADGGGLLGRVIAASAGAQRGVARVEVHFNGFKWGEVPGVAFQLDGQPDPSTYSLPVPAGLPDSIVDVKTVAFDDLEIATESAVVTVTKGAPCQTADTCANGQKCEAGKCFWDPPVGELGASCSYLQFCKSMLCQGTKDQQICTQSCVPTSTDSCPEGFSCVMSGTASGVCFFSSSGGCCSVDRGGSGWVVHCGFAAAVLGFLFRRRRR